MVSLRAPDSCGMPSRSLSSAGITDICESVASAPHRTRSYSSCPSAAAITAEVAIASEPWIASSATCTALSAPIDSALRIASVAESGPTVSTVTSPPSRSRTSSASSMAYSSISLITLSAVARATVLSAGSSDRALPESGTCLTRTTMFTVLFAFRVARSAAEDEAHRLAASGQVAPEDAADGGGDRARAGLADAAHGHAQVLGLDDDQHPAWLEHVGERVGDLRGHPLLHLRAPGVDLDQPGQLGQPGHAAVLAGDVADVRHPVEGHQVVLAGRVHRDVLDQHQLVVVLVERARQDLPRVLPEAGEDLGVRAGHPRRGVLEPRPVGVLPHRDEQLPDGGLGTGAVDAADRAVDPPVPVLGHRWAGAPTSPTGEGSPLT